MPILVPLALLAWVLAEIAAFVAVGRALGIFWTLLAVVAVSAGGLLLLRVQGLATLLRARASLARGEPPLAQAFDGACLALAALLFLVPGFLSDLAALALLVPPVRAALRRLLALRFPPAGPPGETRAARVTVIEAEFEDVTGRPPEDGRRP
jgi:UPF0716 protein FxsA